MGLLVNEKEFKQKEAIEALRVKQYADALAGIKPKLVKANRSPKYNIPENGQHLVWIVSEKDEPSADRRSIKVRYHLTSITKEMFAQFIDKSGDFKNHVFVNAQKTSIVHYPEDGAVDPIYDILNSVSVNVSKRSLESENEELKKKFAIALNEIKNMTKEGAVDPANTINELKKQVAELTKDKPKRGRKPVVKKDETDTNSETK